MTMVAADAGHKHTTLVELTVHVGLRSVHLHNVTDQQVIIVG